MPVDPKALLDDLSVETAALVHLLEHQPDSAWDRPSPAPGWTVRDQLTHLAYFDQVAVTSATDPEAFREEILATRDGVDAYTEHVAARFRSMSGAEVLAWFAEARGRMVEVFAAVDPSAKVPWFGPDMSAASSLTARIMETWAHGQDVFDALGASHPDSPALRHVAHIGVRALPNSFRARALDVPDVAIRVELQSPEGDTWSWGEPDATERVTGPALDFCLVATQRRHLDDTSLVASGPVGRRWLGVAQAFAGPPGAGRQPGQFAP